MLFVSGEKPGRFQKALDAGADLVCIDLEDAVHPDRKDQARQDVLAFAAQRVPGRCALAARTWDRRTGQLGVRAASCETSGGPRSLARGRAEVLVRARRSGRPGRTFSPPAAPLRAREPRRTARCREPPSLPA